MWKKILLLNFILLLITSNCFGALVKGTNCGFVSSAPSVDPDGAGGTCDNYSIAFKDTSPADATGVSRIGWWCDTATEESNFEVGIYSHDAGNNRPNVLLSGADKTNAKGETAGWKSVTGLSITISASTTYWAAFQLDNTTTTTQLAVLVDAGELYKYAAGSTLPDPWTADTGFARLAGIYAVYSTAAVAKPQFIFIMEN